LFQIQRLTTNIELKWKNGLKKKWVFDIKIAEGETVSVRVLKWEVELVFCEKLIEKYGKVCNE
jgi:hypothetical protein